jgi:hypothetical protein
MGGHVSSGPLSAFEVGYVRWLVERGYRPGAVADRLGQFRALSRWLEARGLPAAELGPGRVEEFLAARRAAGYRSYVAASSVRVPLEYLIGIGVAPLLEVSTAPSPVDRLLEEYRRYLLLERRGAGAGCPRALKTVGEHPVQLADMPERERPQERPQRRRRRHPVPEHSASLPRTQHAAVLDAVRPQTHRREQAHHLAPRIRRTRMLAKIDRLINQRLQTQPPRQQRQQHHARVRDHPLIVEHDPRCVRQTVHHAGDLLVQARRRPTRQLSACSGGHLDL